jgi:hypothetical protein
MMWRETRRIQAGPLSGTEVTDALIPEIGVIAEPTAGGLRPFMGGGIGAAFSLSRFRSGAALYGTLGMRARLSGRWSLRAETRIRSVRPFVGRTFDVLFGLGGGW